MGCIPFQANGARIVGGNEREKMWFTSHMMRYYEDYVLLYLLGFLFICATF